MSPAEAFLVRRRAHFEQHTTRGEVTHTFDAQRGVLGGASVPFFALHEDRVFAGKEAQVIEFLANFGLSRGEAEEVVASVGTGP